MNISFKRPPKEKINFKLKRIFLIKIIRRLKIIIKLKFKLLI